MSMGVEHEGRLARNIQLIVLFYTHSIHVYSFGIFAGNCKGILLMSLLEIFTKHFRSEEM